MNSKSEGYNLLQIITQPKKVFTHIKLFPNYVAPLIISIVLFLISALVISAATVVYSTEMINIVFFSVVGVIVPVFILSLGLYLMCRIGGQTVIFDKLLSMNAHIYIITALGVLFNSLITLFISGDSLVHYTSLGILISEDSILFPVLESIEIFNLWTLVLIMLGLQALTTNSKKAALLITLVIAIVPIILSYMILFIQS
jgi:hypothetical protein